MEIERTSLRQQIHRRLKEHILERRLPPGTRLSEPSLAAEFGVSRSPLREALLTLEFQGLVSSEVNRGFRVRSLDERTIADVYPVIGALEGLAVRLSDAGLEARLPELRQINDAILAGDRPPSELGALDRTWHERLVAACPNQRALAVLETLRGHVRLYDRPHERGVAEIERSCRQHEKILDAIATGHREPAARLIENHWEMGVDVVVRWLRRTIEEGER